MNIQELYILFLESRQVCTDTRKITPGCIFFALTGEHFDGNKFAQQAIDKGAAHAVVSDASLQGPKFHYAPDTLKTLQALANWHRKQFNIPVLAITGSNGKTTTKEIVTEVLSTTFSVHATTGNFNNHIGVPLTLLSVPDGTELIVCEMGANHAHEIKSLCEIAAPTHGLITNIGSAHLEGFGSIEGVKQAKGELFDYLCEHEGLGFVNVDDASVFDLGLRLHKKITFGLTKAKDPNVHLGYTMQKGDPGFMLSNDANTITIRSKLPGQYNASNMLGAWAVGLHFGVAETKIMDTLSHFVSSANRSENVMYKGCHFMMDAYNANPSSMALAVNAFAEYHPNGWVILGDMKELGAITKDAHRQIITEVSTMAFERIYLIGEAFAEALHALEKKDPRIQSYPQIEELTKAWDWDSCLGNYIFVKGSRSMQLELLLKA